MALPVYDAENIKFSRAIGDKVSASTADGSIWTSARRDNLYNMAVRRFLQMILQRVIAKEAVNQTPVREYEILSGYVAEEAKTVTNNVIALSAFTGNVNHIFQAYNVTKDQIISPLPDDLLRFYNPSTGTFIGISSSDQYYVLDGSSFRLLDGSTTNSTDSIKLRYMKFHTDLVSGGGSTAVVSDTSCTLTGVTVTNFTGVLSSHVNGTLVGIDAGATPFAQTIATYVSSTSFTINAAPSGGDGTMTNCYIIPPSSTNDLLIPTPSLHILLDLATAIAMEDEPTEERLARAQLKYAQVEKAING